MDEGFAYNIAEEFCRKLGIRLADLEDYMEVLMLKRYEPMEATHAFIKFIYDKQKEAKEAKVKK